MAIASMVCSLVGIVICVTSIIGIILGHVALKQIERTGEEGRAFAIVGPTWLNLVRTFGADLEQGGAQVIG